MAANQPTLRAVPLTSRPSISPRSIQRKQTMSARLELRSFNLAERAAHLKSSDQQLIEQLRADFALVQGPEALEAGN